MNNITGFNFGNIYNLMYPDKGNIASRFNSLKQSGLMTSETLAVLGESQIKEGFGFLNQASDFLDVMKTKKYGHNLDSIFNKDKNDKNLNSALRERKNDNPEAKALKVDYGKLAGEIKKESLNAKFMMAKLGKGNHEVKSDDGKVIANVNIKDDFNFEMTRADGSKTSIAFDAENSEDCKMLRIDIDGLGEKLERKGNKLSKEKNESRESYDIDKNKSLIKEQTGSSFDSKQRMVIFENGSSEKQELLYLDDTGREIYDITKKEALAYGDYKDNETKAKTISTSDKTQLTSTDSIDDISDSETLKKLKADPEYIKVIEKRYKNADPEVRKLYDKYKHLIKIDNINCTDIAAYYPGEKCIKLNGNEDKKNRNGHEGSIYYHEVGHLIDDAIVEYGYESENYSFFKAIESDFNNCVSKITEKFGKPPSVGIKKEEAYRFLSTTISGGPDYINCSEEYLESRIKKATDFLESNTVEGCDISVTRDEAIRFILVEDVPMTIGNHNKAMEYNGISDVFDGLSEGMVSGDYTHSREYWNRKNLCVEAFTHMFEAFMGGTQEQRKHLKEIMPNTYAEFMKIVRSQNDPNMLGKELRIPLFD